MTKRNRSTATEEPKKKAKKQGGQRLKLVPKGSLTEAEVATLLRILPRDGWTLIHNMFSNEGISFPGTALENASKAKEFVADLLKQSQAVASK